MKRWRHWLRIAAVLIVVAIGGGFLFAWSGLYNVGASRGHFAITEWVLAFVMENSVETRAPLVEDPPALDNPDLIRLGAAHFQIECASCHGAPGVAPNPVMQVALPPAPDLLAVDREWSDKQLFWIVQHGIKYTGMPAWPTLQRDDEVWAVVAFLKQLGGLDAVSYRNLIKGGQDDVENRRRVAAENLPDIAESCLGCHGTADSAPISGLVPSLQGQSSDFLAAALTAFRDGSRPSGIMQPMAAALAEDETRRLAEFYAGLRRPERPVNPAPASEPGRTIAVDGIPGSEVPPCLSCHGQDADPSFPRLAGQNKAYLVNQLRLWKKGINTVTPGADIMAPIAQRLHEAEIEAVAAYFAGLDEAPVAETPP